MFLFLRPAGMDASHVFTLPADRRGDKSCFFIFPAGLARIRLGGALPMKLRSHH